LKSRCFQRFSYVFIGYDTSDLFSVTTVVDTTSEEIEGTDPHHEGWQFPSLGWFPSIHGKTHEMQIPNFHGHSPCGGSASPGSSPRGIHSEGVPWQQVTG